MVMAGGDVACSPNTVSKFVRFFPKFAAAFIIVHVILLIITSLNKLQTEKPDLKENGNLPKDLSVKQSPVQSGVILEKNKTNGDKNKDKPLQRHIERRKRKKKLPVKP